MEPNRFPVSRIAGVVAIVATIGAVCLHIVFGTHAGALWRDEVTSLEIATMRSLSEMWSNLAFESFPALFVVVLRWFGGVGDAGLRILGVTIGLLILAALWLNARCFRIGVPLVALALIGFNPMIIRYGDSIRAYGLGIFFILLSLGAFWRLLESFTLPRALLAGLLACLSVQTLYYNAVLIFAIGMGASAVTLGRKKFGQTCIVLAIGAVAGLSLLPYWPIMKRVQTWSFIWRVPFTPTSVWTKFSETIGSPLRPLLWVWIVLFVFALFAGLRAFRRNDRSLFVFVTLLIGVIGYAAFLKVLGYLLQPWYFIVLLAFAAMCFEILLANARLSRAAFALLFAAVAFYPASVSLQARQTNIDVIADQLQSRAVPGDLILINPFPFGISFQHYYHGAARVETIPPLSDLRSHRADLLKATMMSDEPLGPVLREMEETLRNGRTIWLIGSLHFLPKEQTPLAIEPGYETASGWVGGNFYEAWSEQAGRFLQDHYTEFERLPVPLQQSVVHYEDVPLSSFRGWKESGGDSTR